MRPADDREQVLFREALQRAKGAEREDYLDRACAGNAALRARLAALLQAHESPDPFLESPAGELLKELAIPLSERTTPLRDPVTEKPGDKMGHYRLLDQIGEGGYGVVFQAEQEEPVKRRVALKVIRPGMDSKQVLARFEAERQALALMDHPNIAKVFDAGATDIGRPFFVMELVQGIKITNYCDDNNLPTEARLDLFVQVCHAIQHAHQKGIIHRDIKPSNIIVTVQDGVPVPKVIDFGVAKATEQRLTEETIYTALEQTIGTPAYMSPEQAEMTRMDIDTRSDIYSLGVLLYELLTGKTPFDVKELLAKGIEEMRRTIREQEPRRPSTRLTTMGQGELTTTAKRRQTDAPKLVNLVRGDLDWIVMKCLEKDRTRRYETANGLASDLLRHIANEPVLARPPSNVYRFQKMVRRNKLAFAATALIGVVLVVATGISVWQATVAKQRLAESETISKFLTEVFQSPDPGRDGRTITVAEALGAAAKKLETGLANQPARRAKLQATLGWTYHTLGLYPEAIALEEKVRDYYLAVSGPENLDTLLAMHRLASSYDLAGRHGEALKLEEEAVSLYRKVSGPENPDALWAMVVLSAFYEEADRSDEAMKLREELVALSRKVRGAEHPQTLNALAALADSYQVDGRWDEALKLREELLALSRKVNGAEHPQTLTIMSALANSYGDAGRLDEALKLREQALALRRKVLGPAHPDTLNAIDGLARTLATSAASEIRNGTNAVRLAEEAVAKTSRTNASFLDTLAAAYAETLQFDKAVHTENEAIILSRNEVEKSANKSRLKLYQDKTPYHLPTSKPGSADGTGSAARFNGPCGVAVDSAGNVYVADWGNNTIREVTPVGTNGMVAVTTLAGLAGSAGNADGTNSTARFNHPCGIAVDSATNLYVSDANSDTIRKVTPVGTNWVVTTIAGKAGVAGSVDGTNSAARFGADLGGPAVDSAGNVFVADYGNDTIRKVSPVGTNWVVTTLAGLAGSAGSADGTNSMARFKEPNDVKVDSAGNLYVADLLNDTIRKVTPVGTNWVVTTLVGKAGVEGCADGTNSGALFNRPYFLALDSAGNLYVVDTWNDTIRKVTPVGTNWVVTTLAGSPGLFGSANGTGSAARFWGPNGLAVDTADNLYLAEGANDMIRKLAPVGTNWVVTTLAGPAETADTALSNRVQVR
jgi:serine/threonine protein kinase/tetratricopeptide (TPR) repeat protein